jgi:hypothetical protein
MLAPSAHPMNRTSGVGIEGWLGSVNVSSATAWSSMNASSSSQSTNRSSAGSTWAVSQPPKRASNDPE